MASKVPCGLINQGMTCYLNAVLQMLFMTDEFRDPVLRFRNEDTAKSPGEHVLKALAELFWSLQHERRAVSTTEVTKALNITSVNEQQDAAEYLQMILHRVPELSETFKGIMVTSITCSNCEHLYKEETEFLSIPLSINERGQCDVDHALLEYLGIHDMSGDDQLYCVSCESMRNMETRSEIKKCPDILTLQLKRFEMENTQNKLYYWKNRCRVKIPSHIQMYSLMDEVSPQYDLYGIINHYGTFSGGHYDAVIKDETGNWCRFDDHTVKKIPNKEHHMLPECLTSAYLLMYRKVTQEPAASEQDEETKEPQTHTIQGIRSNDPQPKNPIPDHTTEKPEVPMISPESRTQSHSPVSESSSKTFKLRLKEEFQYLKEEKSPGERRLLNSVFIEPHISEESDSHISDKTQINIFKGQKIRTVLMKGEAGIGKTVAVQKFILDWAEEKSNPDIKYIFLIPFQKLNIIREMEKECSFMDLLQRCSENTEHLKPDSDRIMLIFDGLHEFKLPLDFQNTKKIKDPKKPASVPDLLTNLIMGNLLPNAQIWITSRPAAAIQIPAEYIDRVTEIQGFNDEQREEYFRKSISDEMKAREVISHIRTSPRINSMCYSPDYCRIIAAIPEEMIRTGRSDFPKTLTQMYSRSLLAQTKPIRERKETLMALGKIAFHLLVNNSSLFSAEPYGLSAERVKATSSIIKVVDEERKSFCFMNHRTQEFLAALYVTEIINGGDTIHLRDLSSLNLEFGEQSFTDYNSLQKVMTIALQKQMDLFFCFLLGLTLESSQRALKELLTQRRRRSSSSQEIIQHIKTMIMNSSSDNAVENSLLFEALRELDDRYLIQQIKTHLKSGLRLSPAEFSSLMIELLNPEEQLDQIKSPQSEELKLQPVDKSSGEHELRSCDGGFADLSSALRSNPSHLRELDLSGNAITDSEIKQLSALLEDPQCKLEKLRLCSCDINEGSCADLSSALRSNPSHLRELDLSDNKIGDSGVKQLSVLLEDPECKLEKMRLRSCHISIRGCAVLSSALRSNPSHLRELNLSENNITDSGVKKLSDLLKHPQCKLEKLRLRSCIGVIGWPVLSYALRSNPSHLRELDLSGNAITDSGVKQLSALLEHPQCKLEKLELRCCCINNKQCDDLSSALRSNLSHLRELDLTENVFGDSGVKQLSALLEDPQCKLEKLEPKLVNINHDQFDSLQSNKRVHESVSDTEDLETGLKKTKIKD